MKGARCIGNAVPAALSSLWKGLLPAPRTVDSEMRIKAQVVAGFVEIAVPRALRFPELEQFSDGHETVPFPLELSNGFLEH